LVETTSENQLTNIVPEDMFALADDLTESKY
jgi:hypothetical protein